MANQSKINDSRFWAIWKASGAVGDIYETQRREDITHFKQMWSTSGNLSKEEISELVQYEFRKGPSNIDEEVRRYYLRFKVEIPDKAAQMLAETSTILAEGIHSVTDVETLCRTLYNYCSGFIIRYGNDSYTVHNNKFGKTSRF